MIDLKTHDAVYFPPFNFRASDAARYSHAVQHVSEPQWSRERLRSKRPDQYEKAIVPEPDGESWFRARIVVDRPDVCVFVNGAAMPRLTVKELGDRTHRPIGLWVRNDSGGSFTKLRVKNAPKASLHAGR